MKTAFIKGALLGMLLLLPVLSWAQAQDLKTIKLNEPNKKRGLPVMEALSVRTSVREWSDKELSLRDPSRRPGHRPPRRSSWSLSRTLPGSEAERRS
jgi:hypothetical protein